MMYFVICHGWDGSAVYAFNCLMRAKDFMALRTEDGESCNLYRGEKIE